MCVLTGGWISDCHLVYQGNSLTNFGLGCGNQDQVSGRCEASEPPQGWVFTAPGWGNATAVSSATTLLFSRHDGCTMLTPLNTFGTQPFMAWLSKTLFPILEDTFSKLLIRLFMTIFQNMFKKEIKASLNEVDITYKLNWLHLLFIKLRTRDWRDGSFRELETKGALYALVGN